MPKVIDFYKYIHDTKHKKEYIPGCPWCEKRSGEF